MVPLLEHVQPDRTSGPLEWAGHATAAHPLVVGTLAMLLEALATAASSILTLDSASRCQSRRSRFGQGPCCRTSRTYRSRRPCCASCYGMRGVDLRGEHTSLGVETRVTVGGDRTLVDGSVHELRRGACRLEVLVAGFGCGGNRGELVAGREGALDVVLSGVGTAHVHGVVRVARAAVTHILDGLLADVGDGHLGTEVVVGRAEGHLLLGLDGTRGTLRHHGGDIARRGILEGLVVVDGLVLLAAELVTGLETLLMGTGEEVINTEILADAEAIAI